MRLPMVLCAFTVSLWSCAAAGEQVMAGPEGAPATLSAFPLIEIPERSLTPPPGI